MGMATVLGQPHRRPATLQCATPDLTSVQRTALEQQAATALQGKKSAGKLITGITYVPIRPHIFRATNGSGGFSLASLNSVMASVNSYYLLNDTGIQFYLAGESPDYIDDDGLYNSFTAFNETSINGHDAVNAMNIYLVNQFDQTSLGGYAYFPANDIQTTRSFILTGSGESNDDLGNRLIPHELGHNFNLYHTFQGSTSANAAEVELVTRGAGANCTTAGDLLCDTPADPYNRSGASTTYVSGCPVYTGTATDPTGAAYTPSITNIMSYYFPCSHDFTAGQYDRIQAGLALRQSHTAYSLTYPASAVTAPGNLAVTFSPRGFVQLTWQDNATNETGYFVERATASTGPFRAVGGVAPNTAVFTDQTVQSGQTYYYRIRPSNTTTGSLSPVLPVPVSVIACLPVYTSGCYGGDGLATLTVNGDKLNDSTDCTAIAYEEIAPRRTTLLAGQPYSFTATLLSANAETVTLWADLNRNGAYETAERLVQGTGSSVFSGTLTIPASQAAGPVSLRVMVNSAAQGYPTNACGTYTAGETHDYGLTILATCPVPAALTSAGITPGGAQLTWATIGDGLRYDLQWRAVGAPAWTTVANLSAAAYGLTGLQPGAGYQWQVRTVCAAGTASAFSAPAAFTTVTGCAAPTNLTVTSPGPTSVVLAWTSIGPGVTYTVQWQVAGGSVWNTQSGLTGSALSLTGLSANTAYNWLVRTSCGSSGVSATVNGPGFLTRCQAPANLAVPGITLSSAQFTWAGTGPFELQWRQKDTAAWTTVTGLTSPAYQLTGLLRGTAYQWQVRSVCSATNPSDWITGADFTTGGCRPSFVYSCDQDDGLRNFTLNNVPLSTNSGCSVSGYGQFTATTATVSAGQTYTFSAVMLGKSFEEGLAIWADLNRNDTFEPGEMLFRAPDLVTDSIRASLTIPAGTAPGTLALRVMVVYSTLTFEPCGYYSYGEAEDYTLTVAPACTAIYSVKAGLWSDPATWSCNQVPSPTDSVEVRHLITLPAQYTAISKRITYTTGGRLQIQAGGRLKLGF